jgi:hypothetical protein
MLIGDIDSLQDESDGHWILSYAILMSLAMDLGKLRKLGLWRDNPNEMRESPWFHLPGDVIVKRDSPNSKASDWPDSPRHVLDQYNETVAPPLCEYITSATDGKVRVNQSNIIYLAKRI